MQTKHIVTGAGVIFALIVAYGIVKSPAKPVEDKRPITTRAFDPMGTSNRFYINQWNHWDERDKTYGAHAFWFGSRVAVVGASTYDQSGLIEHLQLRVYGNGLNDSETPIRSIEQACRISSNDWVSMSQTLGVPSGKWTGIRPSDGREITCYYEKGPHYFNAVVTTGRL